jgi:hypothetical protein
MSFGTATKKTGTRILEAAHWLAIASHNGPREEKIEAIDEAIKTLQEERARLVDELL